MQPLKKNDQILFRVFVVSWLPFIGS